MLLVIQFDLKGLNVYFQARHGRPAGGESRGRGQRHHVARSVSQLRKLPDRFGGPGARGAACQQHGEWQVVQKV